MFVQNIEGLSVKTKVEIKCDDCGEIILRTIDAAKTSRRKRKSEQDYCRKCSSLRGAKKRPQNSKEFWDENKQSDAYYEGIRNRPSVKGENNPMWGKKFSTESKAKRVAIWKKRTGENATNWKGGRLSLNRRVKSALQRRYKWFHRVMERDGCKCQHCSATKELDAHHIKPISTIIKELLDTQMLLTESEKFDWLIVQPEIVDERLENGITLCRKCHKAVHQNWGSHEPKV